MGMADTAVGMEVEMVGGLAGDLVSKAAHCEGSGSKDGSVTITPSRRICSLLLLTALTALVVGGGGGR